MGSSAEKLLGSFCTMDYPKNSFKSYNILKKPHGLNGNPIFNDLNNIYRRFDLFEIR